MAGGKDSSLKKIVLEIRHPREAEETPESMEQVLAGLKTLGFVSPFWRLFKSQENLALEIVSLDQVIRLQVVLSPGYQAYFESIFSAQYPQALMVKTTDPLEKLSAFPYLASGQLVLGNCFYLPLKTWRDFTNVDPLAAILGVMAKTKVGEAMLVQFLVEPIRGWQGKVAAMLEKGIPDAATGTAKPYPQAALIQKKISQEGFRVSIRLLTGAQLANEAVAELTSLAGAFGTFSLAGANSLCLPRPRSWQKRAFFESLKNRTAAFIPKNQILTIDELASLWHPPTKTLGGIRNLAWGKTLGGEPPPNLPVAASLSEAAKKEVNFIARTEFKNRLTTFGIKKADRRRHLYSMGKTGTGKTTLIANMAINDMRNREGLAVIDPHGDLSDILLNYIPSFRINDVCYLDPSDFGHPFHLNPLEVEKYEHRELVASGIVSIFYKLYHLSWGPRLEYIFRNTLLTLTEVPGSTLVQVPELLSNENYREKIIASLKDEVLKSFWLNEFAKMPPSLRSEAISPILNKVGQFVGSPMLRNILKFPHSTVNLEKIMNEGKILIVNLSSGKLGEDNSALLGAMLITKLQLAAMARVRVPEEKRRDFYLYVDEFQNFATSSFVKILSEARKYRLCLTLANQYVGQIDEDIQKAIFGNAGTLIAFLVGASDAQILSREFGGIYSESDLVSLGNFQIIIKLAIDNLTSSPFPAVTLPLPRSRNQNRQKVIRLSQERFTRPI
jgi:hypothetical protein